MHLDRAKALRPGDFVRCPADRGDQPYKGKVLEDCSDHTVHTNYYGEQFIWVRVYNPTTRHHAVWPSNRLG